MVIVIIIINTRLKQIGLRKTVNNQIIVLQFINFSKIQEFKGALSKSVTFH